MAFISQGQIVLQSILSAYPNIKSASAKILGFPTKQFTPFAILFIIAQQTIVIPINATKFNNILKLNAYIF